MGYVDVGEEDYWEAEGGNVDETPDEPADKGKKRKEAAHDAMGGNLQNKMFLMMNLANCKMLAAC